MRRFLIPLLLMSAALPAHAQLGSTYEHWENLRNRETVAVSFADGFDFLSQHPGWPEEKIIRFRTEAAALQENPDRAAMEKFCTTLPPITGRGMFACLRAGMGDDAAQDRWLHQGWVQGDFGSTEEMQILAKFGSKLTQADHINRTERLLYEEKTPAAERMFHLIPSSRHTLYRTRIALINDDRKAPGMVKNVPAEQQHDAGLLYDRIQWRIRHGDDDYVDLLLAAPKPVPYPDLWWPARSSAARTLLAKRDYSKALSVLSGHGEMKNDLMADALWMKGWITLEYRHDAGTAYKDFFALYGTVETPVSKARAAYWAARAAKKNGNTDIAREWMEKAAQYPTVFYGQLAQLSLTANAPLSLPESPTFTAEQKEKFQQEVLVQVARQLAREGDTRMRDLFLSHLAAQSTEPYRFALVADLARSLGDMADGVRIAKLALRKGVVLIDAGWPTVKLPEGLSVERALALAIARQESEFDPTARSKANARGLMQLLPGTAKQTAKKLDMPYRDSMLDDPQTNATLGSKYLGDLVRGFDGSYVLAIASYNAGPANVRKWLERNGQPPQTTAGMLNWIESIPFAETRNYVMRVLENVQVYRAQMKEAAPMQLEEDLVR